MKNHYTVLIFVVSYKIHKNLVIEKALWFANHYSRPSQENAEIKSVHRNKVLSLKRKKSSYM